MDETRGVKIDSNYCGNVSARELSEDAVLSYRRARERDKALESIEDLQAQLSAALKRAEEAELRLFEGQFGHCCGLTGFGLSLEDICPMCRVQRMEHEIARYKEQLTQAEHTRDLAQAQSNRDMEAKQEAERLLAEEKAQTMTAAIPARESITAEELALLDAWRQVQKLLTLEEKTQLQARVIGEILRIGKDGVEHDLSGFSFGYREID